MILLQNPRPLVIVQSIEIAMQFLRDRFKAYKQFTLHHIKQGDVHHISCTVGPAPDTLLEVFTATPVPTWAAPEIEQPLDASGVTCVRCGHYVRSEFNHICPKA